MQRLCRGIFNSPNPSFMVKLFCHKVVLEVLLEPFGKGFSFGESADQFQQFYGFIFFLNDPHVTMVPEKGQDCGLSL